MFDPNEALEPQAVPVELAYLVPELAERWESEARTTGTGWTGGL